jgi:hypothetical protein
MRLQRLLLGAAVAVALVTPVGHSLGVSASGATVTPRAYAWSVLATVPVPPGATPVNSLTVPLINATGAPGTGGGSVTRRRVNAVVNVSSSFEVPASVDLAAYFDAHVPANRDPGGCSSFGNNGANQTSCQRTLACANRHATLCGAAYNYETVGQQQELSVSVYVIWRPIVSASFPSAGVVTVTGYAHASVMSGSSGLISARPTHVQRATLAAALARLRGATGEMCMEDDWLYTITVRSSVQGRVIWRAKADVCPGTIVVSWSGHAVALNGHNCALAHAVRAVLPATARATRNYLLDCL